MDPQRNIGDDFGANDWLIEEMLDQYTEDPDSVDPAWRAYFENRGGAASGGEEPVCVATASGSPAAAPEGAKDAAGTKSAPQPDRSPAPPQPKPATAPAPAPAAQASKPADKPSPAAPKAAAAPTPSASAPKPAPQAQAQAVKAAPKPPEPKQENPVPAKAPASKKVPADRKQAEPKSKPQNDTKRTVLKGAPMRTARNMEASIAVPIKIIT